MYIYFPKENEKNHEKYYNLPRNNQKNHKLFIFLFGK